MRLRVGPDQPRRYPRGAAFVPRRAGRGASRCVLTPVTGSTLAFYRLCLRSGWACQCSIRRPAGARPLDISRRSGRTRRQEDNGADRPDRPHSDPRRRKSPVARRHEPDLRRPRPFGRPPSRHRGRGLYGTHPHPAAGHPGRPRRSRRPRHRPDRDRQDGSLRPADPPAARSARQHELLAGPPSGAGAGPRPTRELAVQVDESVRGYGRHLALRATVVYGGVPIEPQAKQLLARRRDPRRHARPPARSHGQPAVNLGQVEILVLDEADRMLDMGFMPDIRRILDALPARRQNLLFSATFSGDAGPGGHDPANTRAISVAPANATADRVRQLVYPVDRDRKAELLAHLIRRSTSARCSSSPGRRSPRRGSHRGSTAWHRGDGDPRRPQPGRAQPGTRDVQGRRGPGPGGDRCRGSRARHRGAAPRLNFELPFDPQDYIHRIGRTARAGSDGDAISLVCIDETDLLRGVQRLLRQAIPWTVEEGFIPDRNAVPHPVRVPGGRGAPGSSASAGSSSGGRSRGGPRSGGPRGGRGPRRSEAAA